ncbi:T-complex protein 1 subunit beta [Thecamonas trahens ATCC 50062]|uniref:CCT-beta n=1 Tax=Thecamonas trahens ATCC 50062 TaxID=461836 RepID=A0A0L0DLR8_THETB|nr:T-complex protein 1 subunit beta [Thecamonas trahens ATCC 50062]KNC53252.1 T-complex protein 1 subunit beta [Thecamonas trahens ATCC 50062]|eukprot:XP_013754516.1 T-complex protein 1 subunit beta [Thecamonas trahens ATCC 50062]
MASFGLQPVQILGDQGSEERGSLARLSSFVGAIAIGDLVKTTLGPKGMDKILQSEGMGASQRGSITVTNDGATILKSVLVDNPAAKILIEISKVQDDVVGDGTTSVCVLASRLLREAEQLVNQRIHPQVIIQGFRKAAEVAKDALVEFANLRDAEDTDGVRNDLLNIARTTLSSKVVFHDKNFFAEMCVDAVMRLRGSTDLEAIQIIKKTGGSLRESFLAEGFILEKKIGVGQPKRIENARIMVANTAMDTDKVKIFSTRVRVDESAKVAEIEAAEKDKMRAKVEKILAHDINVFINRQLIYNYPEEIFADNGVMAIEHADFDGIERLAMVTGAEIVSTFDHPDKVTLGSCDLIEEILIGESKMIRFSGVAEGAACTIVLRGASKQLLDEAERSLHDALCVLSQAIGEPRTIYGGGASEIHMAAAVEAAASVQGDKQALAMEAFARALRQMPTILADNAGYDSAQLVAELKAAHASGSSSACLDMYNGCIGDAIDLGVLESYKVKSSVVSSAAEAAEMILRVDDVIRQPVRQRAQE